MISPTIITNTNLICDLEPVGYCLGGRVFDASIKDGSVVNVDAARCESERVNVRVSGGHCQRPECLLNILHYVPDIIRPLFMRR